MFKCCKKKQVSTNIANSQFTNVVYQQITSNTETLYETDQQPISPPQYHKQQSRLLSSESISPSKKAELDFEDIDNFNEEPQQEFISVKKKNFKFDFAEEKQVKEKQNDSFENLDTLGFDGELQNAPRKKSTKNADVY
ncbi:Hypothetical_protein [Hexamita inflata]|uniref:Hypothetical_protein n=1 Tax=Hexamita inflata TaxID=28002 RepID=A0AA86NQN1_9EUKA|nr:Hypothetical protein HINF_LOCUS11713 [Hexamita inflata]